MYNKGPFRRNDPSGMAGAQVEVGVPGHSHYMVRGPDISFLSAFPAEKEFLFPPLTYLEPTGDVQKLRVDDATFTVVDVRPQQ